MGKIPRIPSKDSNVPCMSLWRICQKPRKKLHETTRCIFHHQRPHNFCDQFPYKPYPPKLWPMTQTSHMTPSPPTNTKINSKTLAEPPWAKSAQIRLLHQRALPCVEFRRQKPPPNPPDQPLCHWDSRFRSSQKVLLKKSIEEK